MVGANWRGGAAAATLRTEGFEGDVIVLGAEQHPPYERPPLSKEYLRGEATADSALLRPSAWYSDNGVDMRLGSRAVSVDMGRRIVRLEDRDAVPFDRVLIATGGPEPPGSLPGDHTPPTPHPRARA